MSVKVRFAPSPTGRIHVGNIRTALTNFLYAKKQGGQFVLRIDDTDLERSTKAFEDGIKADLTWLGLEWDETFNQSARFASYDSAVEALKAKGLLYACYDSEDELERKRKIQRAQGKPPVYDRAALKLTEADKAKLEAEGRKPHWRFKLSGEPVTWTDLVRGETTIDTASLSDPILVREDGSYLYTLPSVVDDIESGITAIIRGEDHVTNSGAQIEIFRALGATEPKLGHHPLLVGPDGEKLSKRLGALSVQGLREEEGLEPMAILSLLAKIGTSDAVEPRADLDALAADFDLDKFSRAPARFDPEELKRVNARLLHETPYGAVSERLKAMDADAGEAFWNAVRPNLEKLSDAATLVRLVNGPVTPVIEDADYAATAASLLPEGELTGESWGQWTGAIKAETGRKGRDLFLPLRQALTGDNHGPEMDKLLPLMGRERVLRRLGG
ncbi:glutamate--tRNA ligase [Hyphobacterium marinum]|uniref:Glutamate--tRNA ligase n=1 Tax=Hyphobacterium marinum TaxID=3116574 RepID=A0ABU7M167_9PROT|nr:glutamate--tRNA ligase [Hyphobacterium sp. Y6023]MEE2567272.1 glutamate--tRNA ligase [Hyphobacterium sp. Y6023]